MSEQQLHVAGDGGNPANLYLLESRLHCHLGQCASLPTDGANCRDTIFNDPRLTLGSCVKGPNNMICREWVWKVLSLGAGFGSGPGFVSDHTKMSLDCIAEPCINVVWKV